MAAKLHQCIACGKSIMAKMKRCNYCGTSQDSVATEGAPRYAALSTSIRAAKPIMPPLSNSPFLPTQRPIAQSSTPLPAQMSSGGNQTLLKGRLRLFQMMIIGAVIALIFLVFVDELRLHTDVEVAGGRPGGQVIEVDLTRGFGVHQLQARVNSSVDVQFMLDSGASDVTLPEEVVRELLTSGALSRSDFLGEGNYTLANGDVVTASRFILRSITIGELTVSNVAGSTSPSGSPALLGQSFLRKFTSWNVDNTRNKLVLQPPS